VDTFVESCGRFVKIKNTIVQLRTIERVLIKHNDDVWRMIVEFSDTKKLNWAFATESERNGVVDALWELIKKEEEKSDNPKPEKSRRIIV